MPRTILKPSAGKRGAEHPPQPPHQQSDLNGAEPHSSSFHRLYTIREAAELTGLKYWLLLRAVNSGDVPSYQFSNARRRVRLSDIEAAISLAGENRGRA